jgi:hypothetical protein
VGRRDVIPAPVIALVPALANILVRVLVLVPGIIGVVDDPGSAIEEVFIGGVDAVEPV